MREKSETTTGHRLYSYHKEGGIVLQLGKRECSRPHSGVPPELGSIKKFSPVPVL